MKKISIALCTYNGETYLREQLDSYLAQTRLPDELVVCDDGSKDSTREILEAFSSKATFPVKLHFNEPNLGYRQNFVKAAGLCSGDIVVFSDQDDVWREDKLQLIEAEFAKSENIGLVYADAEIVDENLNSLNLTLWQRNHLTLKKQANVKAGKSLDLLLKDGYLLGSSMAFSRKFQDLFLPMPSDIYFDHDDWIGLMISAVAEVSLIGEPLIKYRQHQHQASAQAALIPENKPKPLLQITKRTNYHEMFLAQLIVAEKRLVESRYPAREAIIKIKKAKQHILTRSSLPKNLPSRLFKIGQELIAGHYHAYSNGFKSAAKDLLV